MRARALAAGYRLLYGPLAWAYDPVAWLASDGRWWDWQAPVLPRLAPGRVLEIGCGTGHLLVRMTSLGHHSYGVDRSRPMLRRARSTLQRRGVFAPLVQANAACLPFIQASFHSVVLCFTGLSRDLAVLAEAQRVLAPGGQLVVLEEVLPLDARPLARLAGWVQGSQGETGASLQQLLLHRAGLSCQVEEALVHGSLIKLVVARKEDS